MKKSMLALALLLSTGAAAHAGAAECALPLLPAQSVSDEGVRRVEKQVLEFRKCQAQQPGDAASARAAAGVESAYAKWAANTRMVARGQLAGSMTQSSMERDQREHLVSRIAPMTPVYGSERR